MWHARTERVVTSLIHADVSSPTSRASQVSSAVASRRMPVCTEMYVHSSNVIRVRCLTDVDACRTAGPVAAQVTETVSSPMGSVLPGWQTPSRLQSCEYTNATPDPTDRRPPCRRQGYSR